MPKSIRKNENSQSPQSSPLELKNSKIDSRVKKLKELQQKRLKTVSDNKSLLTQPPPVVEKDISIGKQKKIEKLQKKIDNQDLGKDIVERNDNLNYSIKDVERCAQRNVKQDEKDAKLNEGFTDFTQKAHKKYVNTIGDFKPNLHEYQRQQQEQGDEFYRDSNSLQFGSDQTSEKAKEKLVAEIAKQDKKRGQFSRRRAVDEDADVTFINERNMHFNKKISRAYDKYTADIKQSFERGTAL